ncbi:PAS domain-containing protein [Autumnicola edwardsiae]|uniref:histidine kinase n=1 Tax=Autumnicola edwardsiae TaxID=3075594 RepID=A0ABU3CSJ1_9FLAO|nr:PAS domain-containing protein [Zunongwangia sp. F297]MDT0649319.1 PAS domain-containing protein [Zunongwangia sp. F297]
MEKYFAFKELFLNADFIACIINMEGKVLWSNEKAEIYLELHPDDYFSKCGDQICKEEQLTSCQDFANEWDNFSGNKVAEPYTYNKDFLKWSVSWDEEEKVYYAVASFNSNYESSEGIRKNKENINYQLGIIERKLLEAALHQESDLKEMFEEYINGLEAIFPNMKASILRIEDGKVWHMASGTLPKLITEAIDDQPIGPKAGSCGTSAYTGKRVIVADIQSNELWDNYRHFILPYGIRACWSQPIFNEKKEVIATFANYYNQTCFPTEETLQIFERSSSLIGLILENIRKSKDLKISMQHAEYVNKATNEAIYTRDLDRETIEWSQGYQALFGYQAENAILSINDWRLLVYPPDLEKIMISFQEFISDPNQHRWQAKYRFKNADSNYTVVKDQGYVIRDKKGKALRMIGVLSDITLQRSVELKKELLSEFSAIFSNNNSLKSTLFEVTQLFNEYADFQISEIWLVNSDKSKIELFAGHNNQSVNINSNSIESYRKGDGVPGAVWEAAKLIISDVANINDHCKLNYLNNINQIEKLIGVPLSNNNELIGVWICGIKEDITSLNLFREVWPEISGQLAAEISRKSLEQDLQHIFQLVPDLIGTLDYEGNFKRINKAGCDLLEYSEEDLLKSSLLNLLYTDNTEECKKTIKDKIDYGRNFHYECQCVTGSGDIIWLNWDCTISKEEGLIYAVAKDISKTKELQQLFDNAGKLARIGSWELDIEKNRVFWSQITREIYEAPQCYKPTMVSVLKLLRKDYYSTMEKAIKNAKEKNISWDMELPIITLNGKEIWIRSIGKPETKNNKCIRIYGSFQDVDQRKRAEDRILEHNEILKDIARQQSHDVRAPVARLMGIIDLMQHGGLKTGEKEELLENILESAEEIDSIIRQIADKTNFLEHK